MSMNTKTNQKENFGSSLSMIKNLENFVFDKECYHLLLIDCGSGIITYGEHKELFMAPVVFCLNEKEIPTIEQGKDVKSSSIYFNPKFINNRFSISDLYQPPDDFTLTDVRERYWFRAFFERTDSYFGRISLNITSAKRLETLFHQISSQLESKPDFYWPCRSRSFLIEMLILIEQSLVIDNKNNNLFSASYSEDVEKVILYLYSNYANKITIPDIVAKVNIDRTTLTYKFKEEVGDSIINSLITLRINLASSLLRDTTLPVSEIMYRVGFSDISHFNRSFKKHTGFNPSDYRQTYCKLPI